VYAAGDASVLSQENIERVYGVKVRVIRDEFGRPFIIPLRER
jgi:ABC-type cobalamin/Fe3+-siderophores transport system ATPase subunit